MMTSINWLLIHAIRDANAIATDFWFTINSAVVIMNIDWLILNDRRIVQKSQPHKF